MVRALLPALAALAGCSLAVVSGPAYRTPSSIGGDLTVVEGFAVAGSRREARDRGASATFFNAAASFGATGAGLYGALFYGVDELVDPRATSLSLRLGGRVGARLSEHSTVDLAIGAHVMVLYEPHEISQACDAFRGAALTCRGLGFDLGAQLFAGHGLGGLVTLGFAYDVTVM